MPRPIQNPPNPWQAQSVDYLGEPPDARLELFEEDAKSALSENKSPDLGFRFSVNPYRGCLHACAYCYARPSHQYLGFGAGTDFDRKIVVKRNIAEVLDRELERRADVTLIVLSGNTDAYQAIEHHYRLTRACLEVCLRHGVAVSIITKSALIARDTDLLGELAKGPGADVAVSLAFINEDDARKLEPWAASPNRRLAALRALSDAGVPTSISFAPLILGLNDQAIPEVLRAARDAGAKRAWTALLRLPREVEPVFLERLHDAFPERETKVLTALREARGGDKLSESQFGLRMRGHGPRYEAAMQLFRLWSKRLGLEAKSFEEPPVLARQPREKRQLSLFES